MPERVQRKRSRGWRMPEGAISVTRPGRFGNPFPVTVELPAAMAVNLFEEAIRIGDPRLPSVGEIRSALVGKDLACWCPIFDEEGNRVACHADVLLVIANSVA